MGTICGNLDDITYHFNSINSIDPDKYPKSWESIEQKYFSTKNPPDITKNLESFFKYIEDNGIKRFIIDACMTIQTEGPFKTKLKEIYGLCNLWDPVGASKCTPHDLNDGDAHLKLELHKEIEKDNYIYFDSKHESGKSMYDYVYDDLFKTNCLKENGIRIYLRLNSEKKIESYIQNGILNINELRDKEKGKIFGVAMKIVKDSGEIKYFPLDGGFSVDQLSKGLAYVESKKEPIANLKKIIDYI